MNLEGIQFGAGILVGIVLCILFPNLPNKLREMGSNFQKMQEKSNDTTQKL